MGTRHLICVVLGEEFKVAQYGQWDGYPTGQGKEIVEFLRTEYEPETFRKHAAAARTLTQEEVKVVDDTPNWSVNYPHLSRDCGSDILKYVQNTSEPKVILQTEFAADSLFCEWAYVINLDTNELEVYQGFNHEPVGPDNIFYEFRNLEKGGYTTVKLKAKWNIEHVTLEAMLDLNKEEAEI